MPDGDRKAIEAMTKAIVKKILHDPINAARQRAQEGDRHGVDAILRALSGAADKEQK
jgi:glutamyl-tRNA reductase